MIVTLKVSSYLRDRVLKRMYIFFVPDVYQERQGRIATTLYPTVSREYAPSLTPLCQLIRQSGGQPIRRESCYRLQNTINTVTRSNNAFRCKRSVLNEIKLSAYYYYLALLRSNANNTTSGGVGFRSGGLIRDAYFHSFPSSATNGQPKFRKAAKRFRNCISCVSGLRPLRFLASLLYFGTE